MKTYRPYSPEQSYLLPPSPREWLPAGHLAYFILGLLVELDLGAIERAVQAKDPRGERPYSPEMMTSLLLYAYATGVYSSRRIARACVEDVAFRVLAGGEQPHFTTLNQFRAKHLEALSGLFVQVVKACQSEGLVRLGHVAIDGTKMKANASKHKAMSYDRMQKDDARLRAEIQEWFARAQATDEEEDRIEGDGGTYDPQEEIRRREERLAKMARVREALRKEVGEARAVRLREQAEELRKKAEDMTRTPAKRAEAATLAKKRDQQASLFDDDDLDPPPPSADADLPRNVPPYRPDGTPKPKGSATSPIRTAASWSATEPSFRRTTRNSPSMRRTRSSSPPRSATKHPTPSTSSPCCGGSCRTAMPFPNGPRATAATSRLLLFASPSTSAQSRSSPSASTETMGHRPTRRPDRNTRPRQGSRCERFSRPNVAGRRTPDERPPSSRSSVRSELRDASGSSRSEAS